MWYIKGENIILEKRKEKKGKDLRKHNFLMASQKTLVCCGKFTLINQRALKSSCAPEQLQTMSTAVFWLVEEEEWAESTEIKQWDWSSLSL